MNTKKKLSYTNPDKYKWWDRTLAVLTNKYLNNNQTLKNINYPIIEYDRKIFELNPSVKNKITNLKECIKKQETIFNTLRKEVEKDINYNKQKEVQERKARWDIQTTRRSLRKEKRKVLMQQFWKIPDEFKTIEINKPKGYVSPEYQLMYQYLRPFPDNLIRRGYSTERTLDILPDWRAYKRAPERVTIYNKNARRELSPDTMNYWISYISYLNNSYIKENKIYKMHLNNLNRLPKWITEEDIHNKHKEVIDNIKKEITISKEKLYEMINNPRDKNRQAEWDYDPNQHWVLHTFIWHIYY